MSAVGFRTHDPRVWESEGNALERTATAIDSNKSCGDRIYDQVTGGAYIMKENEYQILFKKNLKERYKFYTRL
jgi:hypothetical protein